MTDWVRAAKPAPATSRIPRGVLPFLRSGFGHAYPTYVARGAGATVWDEHGRAYVDWVVGKGAVTLGHARQEVDRAAAERAKDGALFGAAPLEYEKLALELGQMLPHAEKTIFAKNGSDGVEIALRLARIFTGRDLIISAGYHGWNDRLMPGSTPAPAVGAVVDFGYDRASLHDLAERERDRLAAVVVTPEPGFFDRELLEHALSVARDCSALLIVDEVRAGLRIAEGGAHALFGVVPDLVVLSKGLANGYPLSAVTGRADVLDASASTFIFGTYYAEAVALAAGIACLDIYRCEPVIERIRQAGASLMRGLAAAISDEGVAACLLGPAPMPQILFEDEGAEAAFYDGCAERGILFFQDDGQCPSAAHGESEIETTLTVARDVLRKLRLEHQGGLKQARFELGSAAFARAARRRMIRPEAVDRADFDRRLTRSA